MTIRRGPGTIISQRLAAEATGLAGASSFPDLVSWFETMRSLVGFTGGSTAQVLRGTQVKLERFMTGGSNSHFLHPSDMKWRQLPSLGSDGAMVLSALSPRTQTGDVQCLGQPQFQPPPENACHQERELQPHGID